jgi:hypothetical protein
MEVLEVRSRSAQGLCGKTAAEVLRGLRDAWERGCVATAVPVEVAG